MARNNGDTLVWFLVGAAVGASVALLYAPQSGDRTRRMIGRKLADGREVLEEQGSELLEKSRDLFEKGRKVADDAAELFEKGRSMVKG
ncbi:MAG: YtxH domain-containing protein [Acidobacteriota bacterium]|nr:YtxH domain-containing protein [Acidobacteriota bacterium]